MAEIEVYSFGDQDNNTPVRVVKVNDEPWWVATDVCRAIDLNNTKMAVGRLEDDEKGVTTVDTLGGPQEVTIISESGLYSLILTSRQEKAKQFKKWVTSEVLPSIRKRGKYEVNQPRPEIQAMIDSDPITATLHQLILTRREHFELLARQEAMALEIASATSTANDARAIAKNTQDQVNGRTGFLTVLGYTISKGYRIPGTRLAVLGKKVATAAREKGVTHVEVSDERYASIKSWPADFLESLDDIFRTEDQTGRFKVVC